MNQHQSKITQKLFEKLESYIIMVAMALKRITRKQKIIMNYHAKKGNAESYIKLGDLYANGFGVHKIIY